MIGCYGFVAVIVSVYATLVLALAAGVMAGLEMVNVTGLPLYIWQVCYCLLARCEEVAMAMAWVVVVG